MLRTLLWLLLLIVMFSLGALWARSKYPQSAAPLPPPTAAPSVEKVSEVSEVSRPRDEPTDIAPSKEIERSHESVEVAPTQPAASSVLSPDDRSHIAELTQLAEALLNSSDEPQPTPPPMPEDLRQKLEELSPELLTLVELMIRLSPQERPVKRTEPSEQ